jgi:aryl-alcohol dehydrogenase-like predicted oxidoreductase
VELALGTVQWGLAYGIAGRESAVPEDEVRAILEMAWRRKVRVLDTAAAYGDIEERLARLMDGLPFRVVSKIPPLPAGTTDREAAAWAVAQAQRSRERLGTSLTGLLCHRDEDLAGPRGEAVWRELIAWARGQQLALGASVYAPRTATALHRVPGIALTQLPGNAFDQRVTAAMPVAPAGLEVHLRSAFLQGLLLMDADAAAARLPAAAAALRRWHAWCAERDLSPLVAALSIAKGFAAVSTVVVGVDSRAQFAQIADAWEAARPILAPALAQDADDIIDPRLWSVSK